MPEEMSTTQPKPAFHIHEPLNPIFGSHVTITLNPVISRKLCDLIEDSDLKPDESSLYALAKHIRRHYGSMSRERPRSERREIAHSS